MYNIVREDIEFCYVYKLYILDEVYVQYTKTNEN